MVMEDGSDAMATDHSTFKISNITVSACPGHIHIKGEGKIKNTSINTNKSTIDNYTHHIAQYI